MTVRRRVAILLALMGSLAGACVTHPPLGGSVRAALQEARRRAVTADRRHDAA